MRFTNEHEDLRRRMQALAVAQQPLLEWIAGAKALALISAALEGGILEAARTPRTIAAIAEVCGLAPDRAADLCAALVAHGILERVDDAYRLADAFALLASDEAIIPLDAAVARGVAEHRILETIARPGSAYTWLSPKDRLAVASGVSVNPASPLRRGLRFLSEPELVQVYSAGARHLELGCGIGGGIVSILNTYPDVSAVGVELDADLLAVAQRRAGAVGVADRVEWRHGDARDITEEASFDTVAWSQAFFPTETRGATLAAAFRALKPGGYLLASMLLDPPPPDADRHGSASRAYVTMRLMYGAWGIPFRTADELRDEIEESGFTFVRLLQSPQRGRLMARRPLA